MSTTQPYSYQSIQVCAIRVVRLDATGTPVTGATTDGYIAKAPVMVKLSPDYQAGSELQIETGCGQLGAYYKAPDQLKKYNISFELTDLDSELIEILTDNPIVSSGGATVGHTAKRVAACSSASRNGVGLEFWSKKWNACAPPTGDPYWHWVMPWAFLQTGEYSMQNNFLTVPIEGYLQENPNWGVGPWTDFQWPAGAGDLEACWGVVSCDDIPTPASGYQSVV